MSDTEDMILPFRVIEDVLILGLILGGLERMYTRSLEQLSFIKQ
jgi:hypothetical protein